MINGKDDLVVDFDTNICQQFDLVDVIDFDTCDFDNCDFDSIDSNPVDTND